MEHSALFEQLRLRASNSEMRHNSVVQILKDSTENFPEWVQAIESAQHFILIEMYIFSNNEFGQKILNLLIEKQKQGIQVVLVYDWLGSIVPALRGFFKPLQKAGAQVIAYNPIGFASGIGLISRNHRKSFIIDGHTAFVSGLCISSAWDGNPQKGISAWRDTGVKIQGDAVADVINAFVNTVQSQGQVLHEKIELPKTQLHDSSNYFRAGVVATTPKDNNMLRLDLNALSLANHHLWLTDAYFMPTRLYTQALIHAAQSGVDVRILVPKTSDIAWIARVSRTRYRELLQAGVRIFEWNGSMIHAKSAIADGLWARVGSTNLNLSSWYWNRELDVIIEEKQVIDVLEKQFLEDLRNASEIILNHDDKQASREKRKLHLSRLKIINRQQAKAVARQMMQLSHAFEGNLYDAQIVDERETSAYISLGLTLIVFALLLMFAPYILVVPIILLLLIGGISTIMFAIKQKRKFKNIHKK